MESCATLNTDALRQLDKQHLWHPFTQMANWCAPDHDPMVLVGGQGAWLRDSEGKQYLDGNSSIWTSIHGHNHPHINAAIGQQLTKLAHCSALGFTNEPAIQLAQNLVGLMPENTLNRVFFTDDGSTAIECACKMAIQYRQLTGEPERTHFLTFDHAYHGDTAGAASLGGIGSFTKRFDGAGFKTLSISDLTALDKLPMAEIEKLTAVCIEPLIQGAAGMHTWPAGMLTELRSWCDQHNVLLILDEVMTGFGRTGSMFACETEGVVGDILCLAKGLTGGYLPLAATLTHETIFSAFLGGYDDTFFYGHSYCGNPLGCAAGLANLQIFEQEDVLQSLPSKIEHFAQELNRCFGQHKQIVEIRQVGLIAGIEIGPFDWRDFYGAKVCHAARQFGLLTRPVRDTLVLMPPLCVTEPEIDTMVQALAKAVDHVLN